jgi:hypothetical protein
MGSIHLRRATPGDAGQLRAFRCSTGPWYEAEIEQLVQGPLAGLVAGGLDPLVADDAGEVIAIVASEQQRHPAGSAGFVTHITAGAVRLDRQGSGPDGSKVSDQILSAAVDEARAAGSDGCYARVAVENARVRMLLEHMGFHSGPVPSDPRYLFYTLTLHA